MSTACTIFALVGNLSALTLEDVAFHHTFEEGFTADMARGRGEPVDVQGNPERVEAAGRQGKVLRVRNGRDALVFELENNLNPRQGTISFWLSAGDWDGSSGDALQVLMHTNGSDQQQQLVVQTLWPWGSLFMPLYDHGELVGGFPAGRTCTAPLRQGEDLENVLKTGYFYHYIITWRDGYEAVYLNGKLMNEARLPAIRLRDVGDKLILGWDRDIGKIFWDPGCEDKAGPLAAKEWTSLLDDVTILRSFIFPNEAAKMHEFGALEYARRAEPSALAIEAEFYQTLSELDVQIVAPGRREKTISVAVQTRDGEDVTEETVTLPADESLRLVEMSMPDLPVGDYRVQGRLGSGFKTEWKSFGKVRPDWLGNDLGKADVVLDPWSPVKLEQIEGKRVADVWGRTYTYESPLPAQINSQGADLLAAPVQWFLGQNALTWSAPAVASESPTSVTLAAKANAGAYTVSGETRLEYDGFTWSRFTFRADAPQTVDSLRVDIPFRKPECVFLQYPTRRDCNFPEKGDWSTSWRPYIFVGGDTRGLQWYAESDQWWHGQERDKAIEVVRTADSYVLRLSIVRDKVEMPKTFTIQFGLMGAPVRPRPATWRGWGTGTKYRIGTGHPFKPMGLDYSWWSVSPGWLVPNHRPKDSIGRWRGVLWLPFTSTTFRGMRAFGEKSVTDFLPLWQQFGAEWRALPEQTRLGEPGGWNQTVINPSQSFIDRYAWEADRLFSEWTHVQGLYFDGYAGKMGSANLKAGFGYVDRDGSVKPTYPIRAGRELMRRVYALRLKHKPDGVLMIHPATGLFLPILSYTSVIYDGEFMGWRDITHTINTKGLRAGLTSDKTRFLLNYKAFGLVPYIDTRWITRRALERGGTMQDFVSWHRLAYAYFMLDDIHSVPLGAYSTNIMHAADWWGLAEPDVEYLPHYADKPAATTGWADRSSCWVKRKEGKVLIATLNDSGYGRDPRRLAREGKYGYVLKLDLQQLGLQAGRFRAYDVESLGTLEIPVINGRSLSLRMSPHQFRLIGLERTE
ncbi:MAG: DUF6067 family protein [Kiritimatiellales bacterium]|nr:DUF6067 family protein [Kiritimatiellales bacterium]